MSIVVDAFEQALSESDESTLVAQALYKWGVFNEGAAYLDMPFNMQINETAKAAQSYLTLGAGNYPADLVRAGGIMVNGIPIYAMYGKATHTVANQTQTVTHFTTTEKRKPRYCNVEKMNSELPHVVHGTGFHDLEMGMAIGQNLYFLLTGKGMKHHSPDWALQTPTYPSSKSKMFDICEYIKWGADGSETALTNPQSFTLRAGHIKTTAYPGDDGYYISQNLQAPIRTTVAVGLKNEDTALQADTFARTPRSFLIKVSKSHPDESGYSIIIDSPVSYCIGRAPVKDQGNIVGYNYVFQLQEVTYTIDDHVADTFYAIPT